MAAVQPFISGAISKTVNMPEEATRRGRRAAPHRRLAARHQGHRHLPRQLQGRPAAVHRQEGSGRGRRGRRRRRWPPARSSSASSRRSSTSRSARSCPRTRTSRTFEFRVADCKGFVTVGEYDDGRPGEIFIRVSKQGSTLAGIMDAFAISVSHGLQYGVPLRSFVETFTNMRFEPAGMTDDPDIRIANSPDRLHLPPAGGRLPVARGARRARHPHHRRAHAADAARRRGGRSSRPARADMPSDPPSIESASQLVAQLDPPSARRRHPGRRRPWPRSPTATPRSACSAASRCSGPAPATPAPAAAPPAAAADRPEAPDLVTIRRPLGPRIVTSSASGIRTRGGSAPTGRCVRAGRRARSRRCRCRGCATGSRRRGRSIRLRVLARGRS